MSRQSEKPCAHCQRMFARDVRCTWAYWAKAKYCSQECAGLARKAHVAAHRIGIKEKFATFFEETNGCWEWNGYKDKDGYGLFSYAGTQYRAAKLALQFDGRQVPDGMLACHHCDNPICVRPSHLYCGTPTQNAADAKRRGRLNPGKKAKLTPDLVRSIRAANGTHDHIASMFGISRANVSLIRGRKTWANVA